MTTAALGKSGAATGSADARRHDKQRAENKKAILRETPTKEDSFKHSREPKKSFCFGEQEEK